MVFNLYFSNELTNSYSLNNNYKIYKYSIKKNNDCNIKTSFNIDFKKDGHKKTFGKTLIIGGDQDYLGSILIAEHLL